MYVQVLYYIKTFDDKVDLNLKKKQYLRQEFAYFWVSKLI